jgi:hypothetical protein
VEYYAVYNGSVTLSSNDSVMVNNVSEAFEQAANDSYAGNETRIVVTAENQSNLTVNVSESYNVTENNTLLVSGDTTNVTFEDNGTTTGYVFEGNGSDTLMIGPNVTVNNAVLLGGGTTGDSGFIDSLSNDYNIPGWGIVGLGVISVVLFLLVASDVRQTYEEEIKN